MRAETSSRLFCTTGRVANLSEMQNASPYKGSRTGVEKMSRTVSAALRAVAMVTKVV